jgi:hypothetical protein
MASAVMAGLVAAISLGKDCAYVNELPSTRPGMTPDGYCGGGFIGNLLDARATPSGAQRT